MRLTHPGLLGLGALLRSADPMPPMPIISRLPGPGEGNRNRPRSRYMPAGPRRNCGFKERPQARGPKGRPLNVLNPKDMAILAAACVKAGPL